MAAGSSGQCLISGGTGAPTWGTCGSGVASIGNASGDTSIVFAGTGSGPYTGTVTAKLGPVNLPTPGTGATLAGTQGFYICTAACAITLPAPVAGAQFCIFNDVAVTTVITINALTNIYYGKTDNSGYGTQSTGTMVSTAGAGVKLCLIGRDATHWNVGSYNGTWTNS
jgi:hypothetical protein